MTRLFSIFAIALLVPLFSFGETPPAQKQPATYYCAYKVAQLCSPVCLDVCTKHCMNSSDVDACKERCADSICVNYCNHRLNDCLDCANKIPNFMENKEQLMDCLSKYDEKYLNSLFENPNGAN